MKKRKLVTSIVLSLGVLFSISSNAIAASNAEVTLRTSETSKRSAPIGLKTDCHFKAYNEKVSAGAVYAIAQKANAGKGWVTAEQTYMRPGTGDNGSYYQNNAINWRLELNPEGWGRYGCSAWGKIW